QLRPLILRQRPVRLAAAPLIRVHPVPQRALVDAQVLGDLRDRLAGLPDQPDRALLEVLIELPACLCHRRPPLSRSVHATRGNPGLYAPRGEYELRSARTIELSPGCISDGSGWPWAWAAGLPG